MSRHEQALDQALPAYLVLKPEGANVAEINAAFSAWEIDGEGQHQGSRQDSWVQ
jgi:hypothetical protein